MQVLYGRHHVRVFRFGLRLVRDEQVAEDLISEVFLDVWRQAGKFEGRSAVSTWLLAITRFKALSALPQLYAGWIEAERAKRAGLAVRRSETADQLRAALPRSARDGGASGSTPAGR